MKIFEVGKKLILYLVKKKWFLFGVLPATVVIGVAAVLVAGHFLMTYPGICLHCHMPQTRIMMWTQSVHPTKVTCVNCHAKPGQLFPRKFFARDEFVDKNCRRCHGDVEKKETQISNDIRISHRMHIQELEMRCVDCHRNVVHEKTIPGTNRPSHATCVECHEEVEAGDSESCQLCHM